jgi:large subunit ribosomal protein L23
MRTSYDVIINMIRTEKGTNLLTDNKYLFKVSRDANKNEIKEAVEEIYKVRVKDVNVLNVKGKTRRVRFQEGKTGSWKKAIVTLRPDNKIEVT